MEKNTIVKYEKAKQVFLQEDKRTLTEIAKEFKIGRGRFAKWLNEQGIITQYTKDANYNIAKEMYLQGMSLTKISEKLKISSKRLSIWLQQQNITIINPAKIYQYNENYFASIDDEYKAYWLGFLYADGCVNDNGKSKVLEVGLQLADEDHLIKLNESLNSDVNICYKTVHLNNKLFPCCRIRISSTKLCNDLIILGCIPKKSLVLTFPSKDIVPAHLVKHFVRGYIDGDGWVGISTNKKYARIGVCGTYEFLKDMQKIMGWKETKILKDKHSECFKFECGNSESLQILQDLYQDSKISLNRKYKKYENIIAVLSGNI